MNTLDLRTATLDDMVFEGRNKAYGAFILRRLYHQHLARALAIAVSTSLLLLGTPLLLNRLFPDMVVAPDVIALPDSEVVLIAPPLIDQPKSASPPPATVQPVIHPPLADIPTQVVKDELVKPAVAKPVIQDIGPVADVDGPVGPATTTTGSGKGVLGGTGTSDSGTAKPAAPPAPFVTAEVMPQFVGGNEALMRYMQKNLKYPSQALRANIEGKVFISFTVQSDGSIADVQVLKGLGYGTDEEAARVVRSMPSWIPGQQNKRSVAVRYTLPITFRYD